MNKMKPILDVGVIGLGVGEQHAHMFAGLTNTRVKWLYDYSADQAEEVRTRVGQGIVSDSFEQILEDRDTDIVSIATYDHLHADEVMAAFAAGKHVFVEKPLCRTTDELTAIKASWITQRKPHVRSNLVLRATPLYVWLKKAIKDGVLGDVYAFDGDYLYGRLHKITEGWRRDVPDYSVMEGGGIHLIDLMLWLCGERPARATTLGTNISTRATQFSHDDFMAATFEFPSGIIGRITANFGCVHRHHHVIRVFGTKATFIYDDAGPRLHTTRDETTRAIPVDEETLPNHKGALIPDFVRAVAEGEDASLPAQREFDLVSVTAAADQSLRERQPIEIEYV